MGDTLRNNSEGFRCDATHEQTLDGSSQQADDSRHSAPEGSTGWGTVRIVVDRGVGQPPEVLDVAPEANTALRNVTDVAYSRVEALGGDIPVESLREVVENLVHAGCKDPVITILNHGRTVVVADHGPGIPDKRRAQAYGYTTATTQLRQHIRGVGAGLPRARAAIEAVGGALRIDDNIGSGTVVVLDTAGSDLAAVAKPEPPLPPPRQLSARKRHILMLLADLGAAGPSIIARELNIGLSTAFRELAELESLGLAKPLGKGKRALTEKAARSLMELMSGTD